MKSFEKIFSQPEEHQKTIQHRLLRIVNGEQVDVPIAVPSQMLEQKLHEARVMDSRKDVLRYEESRNDIFESFGVENDGDHIFIKNQAESLSSVEQRAFRAFVVLVDRKYTNPDTGLHESFYGEGRTQHSDLTRGIIELANRYGIEDLSFDSFVDETMRAEDSREMPRWMFFKGFLIANEDELNKLPYANREEILRSFALRKKGLEDGTLKDEEGALTSDESMKWFLTDSNLPSPERDSQ